MRLDTQPLERTYTERRLTQLWCKMQDTHSEFPMIVQAIPGIVCNTQKTMAFLLPLFSYVDMDFWNE